VNYAGDGDLGRSAKALLPQRKASASASTLEELQEKHPAAPEPIATVDGGAEAAAARRRAR
jgi:hypothetical protein